MNEEPEPGVAGVRVAGGSPAAAESRPGRSLVPPMAGDSARPEGAGSRGAGRGWRSWLEGGLGFFYPAVCQVCGVERVSAGAGYVCARCCDRPDGVRRIREPFCERCGLPFTGQMQGPFRCAHCDELELHFGFARAAVAATTLMLDVIHRYKYRREVWFEPFLANLLVQAAAPEVARGGWDCLVPVPLFPVREREREFNQSARLAARLGAATGLPVRRGVVERRRSTHTQTQLSREERAENMRGAFAPAGTRPLKGERVVLVDDVLTTGATTSACARALRAAGAGEVCVWTVARGTWQT